jgi:hypothetical protein
LCCLSAYVCLSSSNLFRPSRHRHLGVRSRTQQEQRGKLIGQTDSLLFFFINKTLSAYTCALQLNKRNTTLPSYSYNEWRGRERRGAATNMEVPRRGLKKKALQSLSNNYLWHPMAHFQLLPSIITLGGG